MKKAHYDGWEAQQPVTQPIGTTMSIARLVMNVTDSDAIAIAQIADSLRCAARPYIAKTDVLRFCLQTVAASIAVPPAKPGR